MTYCTQREGGIQQTIKNANRASPEVQYRERYLRLLWEGARKAQRSPTPSW